MNELKNSMGIILLAVFTVFTGFVVTECAMADLTGREPRQIIELYSLGLSAKAGFSQVFDYFANAVLR